MIQSGYTKLFGSIVASTIWREDDKTRIVWITLLALSDKDGFVSGSIPGLADLARVDIADCERALNRLQQPDGYSRSAEHEGRRIEVIDGGWFILNRAKYRDLIPHEHRREQDRIRQQRYRAKRGGIDIPMSRVTECDSHDLSPQKETKEEVNNNYSCAAESAEPMSSLSRSKVSKPTNADVDRLYRLYPRKRAPIEAKKAIRKAIVQIMAGDAENPAMTIEGALAYLAQRVTVYAKSVQGSDPQYVPYPASWFNAGSFWEDEREWRRKQPGTQVSPLPASYVPASERIRQERNGRTENLQ